MQAAVDSALVTAMEASRKQIVLLDLLLHSNPFVTEEFVKLVWAQLRLAELGTPRRNEDRKLQSDFKKMRLEAMLRFRELLKLGGTWVFPGTGALQYAGVQAPADGIYNPLVEESDRMQASMTGEQREEYEKGKAAFYL
jgi:hypothetical protein